MKRYKLKKDTPAFKAGTECYIEEAGNMVPCRGISYTIVHKDQLEKDPNILTEWFEEVNEPLIKDEKIRKAIRAWAEANEIIKAFVVMNKNMNWTIYGDDIDRNRFEIEFFDRVVSENDETRNYTIDELCGEEE